MGRCEHDGTLFRPYRLQVAGVIVLGLLWSWLWYNAALITDRTLAGWLAREAARAEQQRRDQEVAAAAAVQLAREKEEAVAKEAELEAERKAARDARYAARKKRK